MNLEQIDTSTTAGKAEVMRLAAEGRKVAIRIVDEWPLIAWVEKADPDWNWRVDTFAIIAEPVGPEEVWLVHHKDGEKSLMSGKKEAYEWVSNEIGDKVVRYIRADLAGEKG